MFVLVPLALGRTFVANACAQLEHLAQNLIVRARPSSSDLACRLADVRAVETAPDALAHVRFFRGASIGTTEAHPCAVHEMVSCIAEGLVDVSLHIRVKAEHLAN